MSLPPSDSNSDLNASPDQLANKQAHAPSDTQAFNKEPINNPALNKNKQKRWIIAALVVLGLAILLAILFYKTDFFQPKPVPLTDAQGNTLNDQKNGQPQSALTVSITQPQQLIWEKTFEANGNVAAWQEVVIGSELSGVRITQVNVNVGDSVKRGQTLAMLNTDTIDAELVQSNATVAEALAISNEAAANTKRIQALKDTGAISAQEAAKYLTSQQTAKARLDLARAQIESAKLRQAQATIVAPTDGVIAARTATVGSLAQTGQELFRMIGNNRLEWRAEVTTNELYKLKSGMRVQVSPADPTLPAVQATVRTIAPSIDTQTRYGLVYVDLPTNSSLRMGMFVKGVFQLGEQNVWTLPQSSLLLRDGFAYVFTLDQQNHVHLQKIETGRRLGDRIEVMGLAANSQIVVSGTAFLADGDLVKVAKPVPQTPLNRQLASASNASTTEAGL